VSDEIVLTLRAPLGAPVEASTLALGHWRELGNAEIARRGVWVPGTGYVPLGELFHVEGERSTRMRFVGDLSQLEGLGTGLDGAELVIEGDIGARVAARMRSGRVDVRGSAGWGAGLDMAGGLLEIYGNAGPRAGGAPLGAKRGMSGGEIIVHGSAGAEAGASMRRGLLVVRKDLGEGAGRATIAGTIVALGALGPNPGQWSKRGSIVAFGPVAPPPTYGYACTYRPDVLELLLRHLTGRRGVPIGREHFTGSFRRYSGDLAELGAGEILAWTPEA